MKTNRLILWSRTDIAILIGVHVTVLPSLISDNLKSKIGMKEKSESRDKIKVYKIADVYEVLKEVFPFLNEQQLLSKLMPNDFKG
jgi:hypothetical protein